jgi:hypothetical protein
VKQPCVIMIEPPPDGLGVGRLREPENPSIFE